jgi:surface protein
VTTAGSADIINNSNVPVEIQKIEITAAEGWSLAPPGDAKNAGAGSQVLGWKMTVGVRSWETGSYPNTAQTLLDSSVDYDNAHAPVHVKANSSKSISYEAYLPTSLDAQALLAANPEGVTMAYVVFTVNPADDAYATLKDGVLTFKRGDPDDKGDDDETADIKIYEDFETKTYSEGSLPPWYDDRERITSVVFEDVIAPVSTAYWFYGCTNLSTIDQTYGKLNNLDTTHVTTMASMFEGCTSLTALPGFLNSSYFNTENVTDMSRMFAGCTGLKYTISLGGLDTGRLQSMAGLFSGCTGLTDVLLENTDLRQVTDMSELCAGCTALTYVSFPQTQDGHLENISGMFRGCSALTYLKLGNLDPSHITDVSHMLEGCTALYSLYFWTGSTGVLQDVSALVKDCTALDYLDLTTFQIDPGSTKGDEMLSGCTGLKAQYSDHYPVQVASEAIADWLLTTTGCPIGKTDIGYPESTASPASISLEYDEESGALTGYSLNS